MIRVYSNHNRGFGEAWLEVNLPEINAGWWTDTDDEPISRALLTDKVRFHIETKHIPDGKKIPITILDYDGILNPDDEIVKQSITISGNRGYVELELPYRWLVHIDKDNGDCIELYVKCKLRDVEYTLPKSGGKYLRLYNIGYLAHDNSRVRINSQGNLQIWPENMTAMAHNAWKARSNDPNNWPDNSVGLNRDIGFISLDTSAPETVPMNNEDHNSNANDAVLITERGAKKDGTPDMRQRSRHIVTASGTTRVRGAGVVLAINILIGVWEFGMQYLQIYENNTLKKHVNLFVKTFNEVLIWYRENPVPAQYDNYTSFFEVINITLFGAMWQSSDEEMLVFAKNIYKSNTTDYEKE